MYCVHQSCKKSSLRCLYKMPCGSVHLANQLSPSVLHGWMKRTSSTVCFCWSQKNAAQLQAKRQAVPAKVPKGWGVNQVWVVGRAFCREIADELKPSWSLIYLKMARNIPFPRLPHLLPYLQLALFCLLTTAASHSSEVLNIIALSGKHFNSTL